MRLYELKEHLEKGGCVIVNDREYGSGKFALKANALCYIEDRSKSYNAFSEIVNDFSLLTSDKWEKYIAKMSFQEAMKKMDEGKDVKRCCQRLDINDNIVMSKISRGIVFYDTANNEYIDEGFLSLDAINANDWMVV